MPAFNFQDRFVEAIKSGRKTQTIRKLRSDGRPPCRPGAQLTLYTGQRTKNCQKLGTVTCVSVDPFEMEVRHVSEGPYDDDRGYYSMKIDGSVLKNVEMMRVAEADGFAGKDSVRHMFFWFYITHNLKSGHPFKGWLIRWANLHVGAEK